MKFALLTIAVFCLGLSCGVEATMAQPPVTAEQEIRKFEHETERIRQQADLEIAQRKKELIARLKLLREQARQAKRDHQAAALDLQISQLEAVTIDVKPAPRTLTALRQKVGQVFYFQVKGTTTGDVWGSDVYTLDSHLGTAAVHAGLVTSGETRTLKVRILPGQERYKGVSKNGVNSYSCGSTLGSFKVEPAPRQTRVPHTLATNIIPNPGSFTGYRGQNGKVLYVRVTAATGGSVWGNNPYTDDSSLATVAIHAGLLSPGETGVVRVTIHPGEPSYTSSTQNGITSSPYGSWSGSYNVEPAIATR